MERKIRKYKLIWFTFVGIVIVINLGIGFYLLSKQESKATLNPVLLDEQVQDDPFKEITIPYLRSLEYKSSLGERSQATESESYTGYLTSYTSDGLRVNGYLTIPKGEVPAKGWPAIVFIHGYIPPAQYQTLTQYSSYVDSLAREGFVVFKIDLRGHGDSEGQASGAYYSSEYIRDSLNAYSALQSSGFVNKDGIGFWGHSMAGNVVLRAVAAKPEIPAAVMWAGAVYSYEDREKYGIMDSSFVPFPTGSGTQARRRELFERHGDFDPKSPFWRTVVPTNYLNDFKGAIQLNHAVDDAVVNVGYSRDLDNLLDETEVEHELKEYQSGGHNIQGQSFNLAMENTVNFFNTYLR